MSKTTVDWLRFRTQCEPLVGLDALRPMFGEHGAWLNLDPLPRGRDGFQQAAAVRFANMVIGRCDFGGDSQRGWVRWNITGQGCEWVKDWDALQEVVAHRDGLQRMPLPVGIGVATFFNDLQRSEIDEAVDLLAAGGFR